LLGWWNGRHTRFRFWRRKVCGFDPRPEHPVLINCISASYAINTGKTLRCGPCSKCSKVRPGVGLSMSKSCPRVPACDQATPPPQEIYSGRPFHRVSRHRAKNTRGYFAKTCCCDDKPQPAPPPPLKASQRALIGLQKSLRTWQADRHGAINLHGINP
jgi:hypothetical protein